MFYSKKILFFIITYVMSVFLYFFINKHFVIIGITFNFILGTFLTYGLNICVSFLISLLIFVVFKYFYIVGCDLFKIKCTEIMWKHFWIIFTSIVYLLNFILFLKVTKY
jgi:hypothetical protein